MSTKPSVADYKRMRASAAKYRRERNVYRIAAALLGLAWFVVFVVWLAVPKSQPEPQSHKYTGKPTATQKNPYGFYLSKSTPLHVLGTVKMHNGTGRCSAVVIAQNKTGCLILSAAHCVKGYVGNSATFLNPDGTRFKAKLVAFDRKLDAALFCGEPKAIGVAPLAAKIPSRGEWDAVGYTAAGGIKYKRVTPCPNGNGDYHVVSGPFGGGDSGGGVFVNGRLVGVIARCERDPARTDNKRIIPGCSLARLTAFVRANAPDG